MAVRTRLSLALTFLSALMIFTPMAGPARAETGTVHVLIDKAGFIVGVGGGRGVLTFRGKKYPLTIGGVSIGATIGASRSEFFGRALNMNSPTDIAGTYSAIGAGAAVAAGAGAIRLQNSRGVVLELTGRKVGLEVSAALSGLNVSLR